MFIFYRSDPEGYSHTLASISYLATLLYVERTQSHKPGEIEVPLGSSLTVAFKDERHAS